MLNTIVAEELSQFADELEQAADFTAALQELIRRTITEHKRIIFNGNNYSDEWVEEAEAPGPAQPENHRGRPALLYRGQKR